MRKQKKSKCLKVAAALTVLSCVYLSTYCQSDRYNVVITEVMARPSPTVGLPNVEYVELHNRLPEAVILQNWALTIGSTSKKLPDIAIDSGGYAVIIADKYKSEMSSYCNNLYTLSSLSLADAGQRLTLCNSENVVVHSVSYKQEWHSENIKRDGGWALEMKDSGKPCAGPENWDSSIDSKGGTPGAENSVASTITDSESPEIEAVTLYNATTLRVHFSESVSLTDPDGAIFAIYPDIPIIYTEEVPPDFRSMDVALQSPLEKHRTYSLKLIGEVMDCAGNAAMLSSSIDFGETQNIEYNDLIINEILTSSFDNPDADYIEIYNNSDKILDLKDLKVGYGGDTMPKKAVVALSKGRQVLPQSFVVLCRKRNNTTANYICKDPKALVQCDSLMNFAASGGTIFLTDRSLHIVDKLVYSENMHYPKLLTANGVSLERLSFDRPTQDEGNWFSAAETAGFGTPGYGNSQAGNREFDADFDVAPDVFSPNGDGFDDFAEISCNFHDEGMRLTLTVFNDKGFVVMHLADNVLGGLENIFRWDGLDDRGNISPAGIYVVQIECWTPDKRRRCRKRKAVSIYR